MKKIALTLTFFFLLAIGSNSVAQTPHSLSPSPIHSTVMQSFRIDADGRFRISGGYGYFFTQKKGSIKVLRDGEEIAEYSFRVSPRILPMYEYDGLEIIRGKNSTFGLNIKKSGNYELAFYMGGKKFYSYPFVLQVKSSGDPYKPQKSMIVNGDWNDYAYFYQSSKSTRLVFNAFLRSDNGQQQPSKGSLIIRRDKDNKVVAFYQTRFRREIRWKKQAFILNSSGRLNSKGEYFDTKEWDSSKNRFADGGHTITLTINGKQYSKYRFMVAQGKIQLQGRQVRGKTDPTRFIEGGRAQFWVKRVNGN